MNLINKRSKLYLTIFVLLLIIQCESKERFYRPDLPEQICAEGLVDIDDTLIYDLPHLLPWSGDTLAFLKKVYFEKSFQSDYSERATDPFSDFRITITSDGDEILAYHKSESVMNPELEIPANLKFESGRKYVFHASDGRTPDISAECTVPELPPVPTLISLKKWIYITAFPKEGCFVLPVGSPPVDYYFYGKTYTRRFAEIEFSFKNINTESYYMVLLVGSHSEMRAAQGGGEKREIAYEGGISFHTSNFLNYNLLESNTDGFFYPLKGGITTQAYCLRHGEHNSNIQSNVQLNDTLNAFFIDGSKIPGGNCILKISTYWDNVKYIPDFIKFFRVRLISIPKEAYLFYKSLHTYMIQADDPFSEQVNINGNVVGGNGVISLCRSRELIVYTGQTGGMIDPFF
jgi:hypothetical protein